MTSEPIRDPKFDHLLTPANCAFLLIDYQPIQVSSIRSMNQEELVFNIVHSVKAALNYNVPVVHTAVNIATGMNKPPIQPLMDLLPNVPVIDRTTVNAWEDVDFKKAVLATRRRKLIMAALWTEVCLAFPALDALREGYEVYVLGDAIGGTPHMSSRCVGSSRRAPNSLADPSFGANCNATGLVRTPFPASWMCSRVGTASIPRSSPRHELVPESGASVYWMPWHPGLS